MAKTLGIDIKGIAIKASGHATGAFLTTQINKIGFVQKIQKPVMKGLLTTAIGYLAVPFLSEKVFGKKKDTMSELMGAAGDGIGIVGIMQTVNAINPTLMPKVSGYEDSPYELSGTGMVIEEDGMSGTEEDGMSGYEGNIYE